MASSARTMEKENENITARVSLNSIAPISNIARRNALPDGCQFLTLGCSAIQGVQSNAPLPGITRLFLRVSRQDPAKIGKAIQVAQNLDVEIRFVSADRSDVPLGAAEHTA